METRPGSSDHGPVDRLAEEFLERHRRGERPEISEYAGRHPEWADEIREVFSALMMMEQLKPPIGEPTGSHPGPAGGPGRPPERLGEYRILREVGRGGMGVVYEAIQESLGRHVALKVLPWDGRMDPGLLERFRLEASSAARLHHTNIVPVFGIGEHGGVHYYSMQFIHGTGLDVILRDLRRLRNQGPTAAPASPRAEAPTVEALTVSVVLAQGLMGKPEAVATGEATPEAAPSVDFAIASGPVEGPEAPHDRSGLSGPSEARYFRSVARIGAQVADALAYAHSHKVLHRDIKPSNLLLDSEGQAWVADFGLAKLEGSDGPTRTGDIVGTLRYMAPERFEGRSDASSDVYGLGATLYELLTLRPAFDDLDRARLINRVLHEPPTPPRRLDPNVPRDLETIVLRALEKVPQDRFATAGELRDELRRFVEGRPIRSRPIPFYERLLRWGRRNPLAAGLLTAFIASLVAGIVATSFFAVEADRRAQEALQSASQAKAARTEAVGHAVRLQKAGEELQRRLYASNMQWVQQIWGSAAFRVLERLDAQLPERTGGIDLRGFEWYYWRRRIGSSIQVLRKHQGVILDVACSRDGRLLATAGFSDQTVRVWDLATGAEKWVLRGHESRVSSVAFSPDGGRLASASYDQDAAIKLWDLQSGLELKPLLGHRNGIHSLAFSPDGGRLASAGYDGTIRIWDAVTGLPRETLNLRLGVVYGVAFSPSGRLLAAGHESNAVTLYDLDTKAMKTLRGHSDIVVGVEFSPDGRRLASASHDRTARIWDVATGRQDRVLFGHAGWVQSVSWSGDGRKLVTASWDGTVRVWDAASGQERQDFHGHTDFVQSAIFTPDLARIVSAGDDGTVRIWDAESGKASRHYGPPEVRGSSYPVFSPDGLRLLVPSSSEGLTQLLELKSGRVLWSVAGAAGPAFSPDGRLAASGDGQGRVRICDARTGDVLRSFPTRPKGCHLLTFNADGTLLVTNGDPWSRTPGPSTVQLWDVKTGALVHTLAEQVGWVSQVAFSADGRWMATSSEDDTVKIWNTAHWGLERTLTGHTADVNSVAFSADGSYLVSGGFDGTVRLWEARTGRLIHTMTGHSGYVMRVAFCPDGKRVASGGHDGLVRLWDIATGQEALALTGHSHWIYGVAFSPDGHTLASAGEDGIRLWDATPVENPRSRQPGP